MKTIGYIWPEDDPEALRADGGLPFRSFLEFRSRWPDAPVFEPDRLALGVYRVALAECDRAVHVGHSHYYPLFEEWQSDRDHHWKALRCGTLVYFAEISAEVAHEYCVIAVDPLPMQQLGDAFLGRPFSRDG